MVRYCLHNSEMTRGQALVSGKVMDCHDCIRKVECMNQPDHFVEYKKGYGWADYCNCGKDSFVCQVCGQAKCIMLLVANLEKNTCRDCHQKFIYL